MSRSVISLALGLCVASVLHAQEAAQDSFGRDTRLSITSVPEGATVLLNSVVAGTTPFTADTIQPGIFALTLVHPDMESWLTTSIADTLNVVEGEYNDHHYEFERRFFISSEPFGAEVYLGDSVIGTTPVLIPAARKPLTIRRDGYEPHTVEFLNGHRGFMTVALKQEWHPGGNDAYVFHGFSDKQSPRIDLYVTGGAALVSGVAAAYFKVRADNVYAEYVRTGDPSKLSRTNSLDTAAGIALATTQIALGLFTYFLFSD